MNPIALLAALALSPPDESLRENAADALRRATAYFRKEVATEGGYLWRYSEDLSRREGEGKADEHTVWVQPPGTPSVGLAYLTAHAATGDAFYLDAARDVGMCLVKGQLRSGGWEYRIHFDERGRRRYAYRTNPEGVGRRNTSTLDDNTTQAALRFLARLDEALKFEDEKIHEAVAFALKSLLEVQYPNGGFPQRFDGPPNPDDYPVKKASYPESWSRTYPKKKYNGYYTTNDNLIEDLAEALIEAYWIYDDAAYEKAVRRMGDFILLAQMPDPQPAWAQQYDANMHPAWARRFEPPAVTGGESQGILRSLMLIYRRTGDKKYLEPIPRALAYLKKSRFPNGGIARFFELKTNRPLYFTKQYALTYRDDDMPTHYGFKLGGDALDRIGRDHDRLLQRDPEELKKEPRRYSWPKSSKGLAARAKRVVEALDGKGRWVRDGRMSTFGDDDPTRRVIDCRTFIRNVEILSDYLAATR